MVRIRTDQIKGRVLSAEPSNPSESDLYLDDGTNTASGTLGFRMYNGTSWKDFGLQSGTGGSTTLAGLTDVTIASIANSNRLVYNSSTLKWENEDVVDGGAY